MRIEIDKNSGFCFGVVRAITEAERALSEGGEVCSLGDIVHNRIEVQRLERMGLRTVSHGDIASLKGCRLLVRAHGEPPATFAAARAASIEVIDATCPVVAKLQERVVRAHRRMERCNGQVVLFGKRGHAEVVGLTGQVARETAVVENEEDLQALDFSRPVHFLSQTTCSVGMFERLCRILESRLADGMLTVENTICGRVSSREHGLQQFARSFDAVIFVCGRKSSNGKVLFEVCRAANPHTRNIEEPSELRPEWFAEADSVGICGATSTPLWLMEDVKKAIENMKK
ncbi:MAG: 4-hydroxy-3-methylbut-2-enyl diphosphate reductase [Alistipes sp.]|nr:4-hydroxy-3-methylbut-2-enyl diphosphate reductase [Alistipes sp.]